MAKDDGDRAGMSPNAMLGLGLALCAALVVVALVGMRFLKSTPPPPPAPPPAPPVAQSINTTLKFSSGYYKATLDDDAKKFQIPPPPVETLAAPLPFFEELAEPRTLKAEKDVIETPHLRIVSVAAKEWSATGAAQRLRVEHAMLKITNKSDRPVAYRVDTQPAASARCQNKGTIAHNAVALRPGETIERSECLWSRGMTLGVRSIQVLELPDLGYFYVSRLSPSQILLDERATAGHEPPAKLKPCTFVPWREIRAAAEVKGGATWSDVVDFYARHNCDEYSFFPSYRRWTTAGQLPAQPVQAGLAGARTP